MYNKLLWMFRLKAVCIWCSEQQAPHCISSHINTVISPSASHEVSDEIVMSESFMILSQRKGQRMYRLLNQTVLTIKEPKSPGIVSRVAKAKCRSTNTKDCNLKYLWNFTFKR